MAQQVHPLDHATWAKDRQSRHGQETSDASILDDAPGMELPASYEIRFARGTARTSPWCAVEHRVIDWASRSSSQRSFELVIMIEVVTEEMHGSD